ncbi:AsmA-like C-terminal domain-containing protein [Campylobacter ureolyticus]|uniref:YhdP family protein n=1 Tax=Campylobacter ureolyticus TaxID=827 RepID=UPI002912C666|nr:AsmA-like C-terminal domain-containing protein [Campylobacter ureolyticus]MDU7070703.1 AsmA-like C-terminal domain-containing protein [Campylobacter ureolyticus]
MKIISKIAKITLTIVVILAIILSVFFVILKNGINIGNIDRDNIHIERLYIKFDKKLIINAKNLKIKKNLNKNDEKKEFSALDLDKIFSYIVYLNRFFEEINLENVEIGKNNITALFKDNIFYFDTEFLKIDIEIIPKENSYDIAISELSFKDFDLVIAGSGYINLINKLYSFDGFFLTHEINGKLDFSIKNGLLKYEIKSATATSIKNFMDELGFKTGMDQHLKEWIYGKVIAKYYDIKYLNGMIDIVNLDYKLNKMNGFAKAYDLNVTFNEKLPSAVVKSADIALENGNLYFDLFEPTYQNKDLNGSKVDILNIMDGTTKIIVDIKTDSLVDNEVLNLLKAYNINLPILQQNGNSKTEVLLYIQAHTHKIDVLANSVLKNSDILISGAKFNMQNLEVLIKNSKIDLEALNISNKELFKASNLKGKIDAKVSKANLTANFEEVFINDIFKRKNFSSDLKLDFSKPTVLLEIPKLNTKIKFDKTNEIEVSNLKDLIQYSKILTDLGFKNGNLVVNTKDFKDYKINIKDTIFDLPLYKKDGSKYDSDEIYINYKNGEIYANTNYLNFKQSKKDMYLDINGLDFELKYDKNTSSQTNFPKINISGKNSDIILKDINKTLNLSSFNGNLDNKNIKFDANLIPQGNLTLQITPQILSATGLNLNSQSLNNFLKSKSFEGGEFNIKVFGKSIDEFRGEILMNDTYLTDLVLYQRLLSFLDSIPSLLKLKTPDFNNKGFNVKKGKVLFIKKGDIIYVQAMDFKGSTADMGGVGTINLKTKEIDLDIEVKYLKDASSIIASIPLVNQIILGKDRSISTVVKIRGTLDSPTYSNKALQDALLSPLNIIKNTLELPFTLFE